MFDKMINTYILILNIIYNNANYRDVNIHMSILKYPLNLQHRYYGSNIKISVTSLLVYTNNLTSMTSFCLDFKHFIQLCLPEIYFQSCDSLHGVLQLTAISKNHLPYLITSIQFNFSFASTFFFSLRYIDMATNDVNDIDMQLCKRFSV